MDRRELLMLMPGVWLLGCSTSPTTPDPEPALVSGVGQEGEVSALKRKHEKCVKRILRELGA